MPDGSNSPEIPLKLDNPKKGIFNKAIGALQEVPFVAAWRKERLFNSLGKDTVKKLLTDIETGGLVIQEGRSQKYWVWLGNDKGQSYFVTALIEPPKPWKDSTLYLEAGDNNLPVGKSPRSLTGEMEPNMQQGSTIPFSDAKWQGDITFNVALTGQQISKEEQVHFLGELLNAVVDEKMTQSEYTKASHLASWVGGKKLTLSH